MARVGILLHRPTVTEIETDLHRDQTDVGHGVYHRTQGEVLGQTEKHVL